MSDIVLAIVDEIKKLDRVDCSIGGNYCIAVRFDCAWICSLWIRGDKVTCDDGSKILLCDPNAMSEIIDYITNVLINIHSSNYSHCTRHCS